MPLHEQPTATQDDRPSRALLRRIARLRLQNVGSRASVVDPAGRAVVTMTTHGARTVLVWVALESIARGEELPRRLILILEEPELARPLTRPLQRLVRRGLEIMPAQPGLRVHAKYWPYVCSSDDHELPLAVSDDDMIYPKRWLRELADAHAARPALVHAFRAHRITCEDGALALYRTWQPATGTDASFAHFGTGVSGQILPPALLQHLRAEGEAFLDRSPHADDIWLHAVALRAGIATAQVEPESQNFPFVPATQSTGLYQANVSGGQNDAQLARALEPEDIGRICRASSMLEAGPRPEAPLFVAWGRFTDNPWQDIVEHAARRAGFDTVDAEHGATLSGLLARASRGGLVVHLNWTAPLTQRADTESEALASARAALDQVDLLRRAGGVLIWTVHNVLPHEQRHHAAEVLLLRGLAERADVVHVMHPATATAVADVWRLPLERQAIVPHPSYRGVYPDDMTRAEARAALGIPADRTVVLFHGLLRGYKGIRDLAAGFLAARAERDDLHVLIAGRPGVGFDEQELESLRDRDDATIHVGYVPADEVQRWHRAADALVVPYRVGLNSGAVQLAATFDLPVIGFPCMAVEAAVAEGWAVMVDPASSRWLLDGLESLRADARSLATASAERRSPERIGDEFVALAREAVERRRADTASLPLAAVVVSFGSAEMIETGLGSLLGGMPTVIVENPTTSGEHERLVEVATRLGARLVVMASNVGFGAAVNAGVAEARAMGAERVLLLNPDVEAQRPAIDRLLDASRAHPRAIISPRIAKPDGAIWFEGGVIDWHTGVARHRDAHESDRPLEWLTGACLLIPMEAWDALGGFDEDFFLYWEDVELTHRWARMGELLVERDATVTHRVGATQGTEGKSGGYTYYNARNRLLFAAKHAGARRLLSWSRSAGGYADVLVARSGAPDARAIDEHRRVARRGARNGALRALAAVVRSGGGRAN